MVDLASILDNVASRYGISRDYLSKTMAIESGRNPNAASPTGARGLFQFTQRTGASYGLDSSNIFDPSANAEAMGKLTADNTRALEARGIPATDFNLYLAHQQGVQGAAEILSGNVSAQTQKNMDAQGVGTLSAADFVSKFQAQYNKGDTSGKSLPSQGFAIANQLLGGVNLGGQSNAQLQDKQASVNSLMDFLNNRLADFGLIVGGIILIVLGFWRLLNDNSGE